VRTPLDVTILDRKLAAKRNVWAVGSYQGHQPAGGKWWLTGVVWDWQKF
jgi:hypothetical protein